MEDSRDSNAMAQDGPRVVVVGDAESARPYLQALSALSRAGKIEFVDLSETHRAADTMSKLTSTGPKTAADWEGVDAFVHCGPLAGDPESVALAASSGKPIFVASRGGRHRADARTVRACIEAGEIGRVVFARFAAGNRPDGSATTTHPESKLLAWQDREHVLDMLGWWIGEKPETVYAQRTDDYESVTVRYADGATAVSDISSAGPTYREIVVVGTSASISVPWSDHANVLLPADGNGAKYLNGSPSPEAVLEAWLEGVRAGTAPIIEESELAAAIALEEAIERSVDRGEAAAVEASRGTGSQP